MKIASFTFFAYISLFTFSFITMKWMTWNMIKIHTFFLFQPLFVYDSNEMWFMIIPDFTGSSYNNIKYDQNLSNHHFIYSPFFLLINKNKKTYIAHQFFFNYYSYFLNLKKISNCFSTTKSWGEISTSIFWLYTGLFKSIPSTRTYIWVRSTCV